MKPFPTIIEKKSNFCLCPWSIFLYRFLWSPQILLSTQLRRQKGFACWRKVERRIPGPPEWCLEIPDLSEFKRDEVEVMGKDLVRAVQMPDLGVAWRVEK